jgi:hypothetical protein
MENDEYRTIRLTRGQFAIVDLSDFDWLNQCKWHAEWDRHTKSFRAVRTVYTPNPSIPKKNRLRHCNMARLILGLIASDKHQADHINRNTLDNRRANLRPVTNAQNRMNSKLMRTSGTGFKGVTAYRNYGTFRAQICIDGKKKHLGIRSSAEAAHRELYIPAALEAFGEFARFA